MEKCKVWFNREEIKEIERRARVEFSLRELRNVKGLTQEEIAKHMNISKSLYHAIENGTRRPSIDVVMKLAVLYGTSMDFIYHAFYRSYVVWHFPDEDMKYALRQSMRYDAEYLKERTEPIRPPRIRLTPTAAVAD